jgi:AmpE protein
MALLTLLLALILERLVGSLAELRRFTLWDRYLGMMVGRLQRYERLDGAVRTALLLLPPLALLTLLTHAFQSFGWGWQALFGLVALLYSLGPRDLEGEVDALIDAWQRDDRHALYDHVAQLLEDDPPADGAQLPQILLARVVTQFNDRLLVPIFWFLLLGPLAAIAWRWIAHASRQPLLRDSALGTSMGQLQLLLAWLPARVAVAGFALAGNFAGTIQG